MPKRPSKTWTRPFASAERLLPSAARRGLAVLLSLALIAPTTLPAETVTTTPKLSQKAKNKSNTTQQIVQGIGQAVSLAQNFVFGEPFSSQNGLVVAKYNAPMEGYNENGMAGGLAAHIANFSADQVGRNAKLLSSLTKPFYEQQFAVSGVSGGNKSVVGVGLTWGSSGGVPRPVYLDPRASVQELQQVSNLAEIKQQLHQIDAQTTDANRQAVDQILGTDAYGFATEWNAAVKDFEKGYSEANGSRGGVGNEALLDKLKSVDESIKQASLQLMNKNGSFVATSQTLQLAKAKLGEAEAIKASLIGRIEMLEELLEKQRKRVQATRNLASRLEKGDPKIEEALSKMEELYCDTSQLQKQLDAMKEELASAKEWMEQQKADLVAISGGVPSQSAVRSTPQLLTALKMFVGGAAKTTVSVPAGLATLSPSLAKKLMTDGFAGMSDAFSYYFDHEIYLAKQELNSSKTLVSQLQVKLDNLPTVMSLPEGKSVSKTVGQQFGAQMSVVQARQDERIQHLLETGQLSDGANPYYKAAENNRKTLAGIVSARDQIKAMGHGGAIAGDPRALTEQISRAFGNLRAQAEAAEDPEKSALAEANAAFQADRRDVVQRTGLFSIEEMNAKDFWKTLDKDARFDALFKYAGAYKALGSAVGAMDLKQTAYNETLKFSALNKSALMEFGSSSSTAFGRGMDALLSFGRAPWDMGYGFLGSVQSTLGHSFQGMGAVNLGNYLSHNGDNMMVAALNSLNTNTLVSLTGIDLSAQNIFGYGDARRGSDGRWRMPDGKSVPETFQAILRTQFAEQSDKLSYRSDISREIQDYFKAANAYKNPNFTPRLTDSTDGLWSHQLMNAITPESLAKAWVNDTNGWQEVRAVVAGAEKLGRTAFEMAPMIALTAGAGAAAQGAGVTARGAAGAWANAANVFNGVNRALGLGIQAHFIGGMAENWSSAKTYGDYLYAATTTLGTAAGMALGHYSGGRLWIKSAEALGIKNNQPAPVMSRSFAQEGVNVGIQLGGALVGETLGAGPLAGFAVGYAGTTRLHSLIESYGRDARTANSLSQIADHADVSPELVGWMSRGATGWLLGRADAPSLAKGLETGFVDVAPKSIIGKTLQFLSGADYEGGSNRLNVSDGVGRELLDATLALRRIDPNDFKALETDSSVLGWMKSQVNSIVQRANATLEGIADSFGRLASDERGFIRIDLNGRQVSNSVAQTQASDPLVILDALRTRTDAAAKAVLGDQGPKTIENYQKAVGAETQARKLLADHSLLATLIGGRNPELRSELNISKSRLDQLELDRQVAGALLARRDVENTPSNPHAVELAQADLTMKQAALEAVRGDAKKASELRSTAYRILSDVSIEKANPAEPLLAAKHRSDAAVYKAQAVIETVQYVGGTSDIKAAKASLNEALKQQRVASEPLEMTRHNTQLETARADAHAHLDLLRGRAARLEDVKRQIATIETMGESFRLAQDAARVEILIDEADSLIHGKRLFETSADRDAAIRVRALEIEAGRSKTPEMQPAKTEITLDKVNARLGAIGDRVQSDIARARDSVRLTELRARTEKVEAKSFLSGMVDRMKLITAKTLAFSAIPTALMAANLDTAKPLGIEAASVRHEVAVESPVTMKERVEQVRLSKSLGEYEKVRSQARQNQVQRVYESLIGNEKAASVKTRETTYREAMRVVSVAEESGAWTPDSRVDIQVKRSVISSQRAMEIAGQVRVGLMNRMQEKIVKMTVDVRSKFVEDQLSSRGLSAKSTADEVFKVWKQDSLKKWRESKQVRAIARILSGESIGIQMSVGGGKTIVVQGSIKGRLIQNKFIDADVVLKSKPELDKYKTDDVLKIPQQDVLREIAKAIGVDRMPTVYDMAKLAEDLRSGSKQAKAEALAKFRKAMRDGMGVRLWTSEAMGHLTTHSLDVKTDAEVGQLLRQARSRVQRIVLADEGDILLSDPVQYILSGNSEPLGKAAGSYSQIAGKIMGVVGYEARGKGEVGIFGSSKVGRVTSLDAFRTNESEKVYFVDRDGQVYVSKPALAYLERAGIEPGQFERVVKAIEPNSIRQYMIANDVKGNKVLAPISSSEGRAQVDRVLQDPLVAVALVHALGYDSANASQFVRKSKTGLSSSGGQLFVGQSQVVLLSGSLDAVKGAAAAFGAPVESIGAAKDVYLASRDGGEAQINISFESPEKLASGIADQILLNLNKSNSRRQLFISMDSSVRSLVEKELLARGISKDRILRYDESSAGSRVVDGVEMSVDDYAKHKAEIVLGSMERAGRGVDYQFDIDEIVDVTGMRDSDLVQALGRVDRRPSQSFSRSIVGLRDVINEVAASAYGKGIREGLLSAGFARGERLYDQTNITGYGVLKANASFDALASDTSHDASFEKVRLAAWRQEMSASSQGMESNITGLIRDLHLENPLMQLAKHYAGTPAGAAIQKTIDRMLNHDFRGTSIKTETGDAVSGSSRMRRNLEGLQREALGTLADLDKTIRSKRGQDADDLRKILKMMRNGWEDVSFVFDKAASVDVVNAASLQERISAALKNSEQLAPVTGGRAVSNKTAVLIGQAVERAEAGVHVSNRELVRIQRNAIREVQQAQAQGVSVPGQTTAVANAAGVNQVRAVVIGASARFAVAQEAPPPVGAPIKVFTQSYAASRSAGVGVIPALQRSLGDVVVLQSRTSMPALIGVKTSAEAYVQGLLSHASVELLEAHRANLKYHASRAEDYLEVSRVINQALRVFDEAADPAIVEKARVTLLNAPKISAAALGADTPSYRVRQMAIQDGKTLNAIDIQRADNEGRTKVVSAINYAHLTGESVAITLPAIKMSSDDLTAIHHLVDRAVTEGIQISLTHKGAQTYVRGALKGQRVVRPKSNPKARVAAYVRQVLGRQSGSALFHIDPAIQAVRAVQTAQNVEAATSQMNKALERLRLSAPVLHLQMQSGLLHLPNEYAHLQQPLARFLETLAAPDADNVSARQAVEAYLAETGSAEVSHAGLVNSMPAKAHVIDLDQVTLHPGVLRNTVDRRMKTMPENEPVIVVMPGNAAFSLLKHLRGYVASKYPHVQVISAQEHTDYLTAINRLDEKGQRSAVELLPAYLKPQAPARSVKAIWSNLMDLGGRREASSSKSGPVGLTPLTGPFLSQDQTLLMTGAGVGVAAMVLVTQTAGAGWLGSVATGFSLMGGKLSGLAMWVASVWTPVAATGPAIASLAGFGSVLVPVMLLSAAFGMVFPDQAEKLMMVGKKYLVDPASHIGAILMQA